MKYTSTEVNMNHVQKERRISVFCSAAMPSEFYVEHARTLGSSLATEGYALVWGGGDVGLMGVMAREFNRLNAQTYAVSIAHLHHEAVSSATEMTVAKTLARRKALMIKQSDAVLVLPGGPGTLDEFSESLELKKHGLYDGPIIVLNSNGYYDGLRQQLKIMMREGLLRKNIDDLVYFASTPTDVMRHLRLAFDN